MIAIFMVFYPLSLGANVAFVPFTGEWPLVWRVLETVFAVTPVMTYLALPWVTRALRPWLTRGLRAR